MGRGTPPANDRLLETGHHSVARFLLVGYWYPTGEGVISVRVGTYRYQSTGPRKLIWIPPWTRHRSVVFLQPMTDRDDHHDLPLVTTFQDVPPGPMLTVDEMAEYLGIPPITVKRALLRGGVIPFLRPTERTIRVHRSDFIAYLEAERASHGG